MLERTVDRFRLGRKGAEIIEEDKANMHMAGSNIIGVE
jgi:hypothetical protein